MLLPWPLSPHVILYSRSFLSSKVIRIPAWWLASKNTQRLPGVTSLAQHWHCILLSKLSHRAIPESLWQRTALGHQYQAAWVTGGAPKLAIVTQSVNIEPSAAPGLLGSVSRALRSYEVPSSFGNGVGQVMVVQDTHSTVTLIGAIWILEPSWHCVTSTYFLELLPGVGPFTFLIFHPSSDPI